MSAQTGSSSNSSAVNTNTGSSSSIADPRKSLEQVFKNASIVFSGQNSPQRRPLSRGSRTVASPGFAATRSNSSSNVLDAAKEGNESEVAAGAGDSTGTARPESRESNWEAHQSRSPLFKHSPAAGSGLYITAEGLTDQSTDPSLRKLFRDVIKSRAVLLTVILNTSVTYRHLAGAPPEETSSFSPHSGARSPALSVAGFKDSSMVLSSSSSSVLDPEAASEAYAKQVSLSAQEKFEAFMATASKAQAYDKTKLEQLTIDALHAMDRRWTEKAAKLVEREKGRIDEYVKEATRVHEIEKSILVQQIVRLKSTLQGIKQPFLFIGPEDKKEADERLAELVAASAAMAAKSQMVDVVGEAVNVVEQMLASSMPSVGMPTDSPQKGGHVGYTADHNVRTSIAARTYDSSLPEPMAPRSVTPPGKKDLVTFHAPVQVDTDDLKLFFNPTWKPPSSEYVQTIEDPFGQVADAMAELRGQLSESSSALASAKGQISSQNALMIRLSEECDSLRSQLSFTKEKLEKSESLRLQDNAEMRKTLVALGMTVVGPSKPHSNLEPAQPLLDVVTTATSAPSSSISQISGTTSEIATPILPLDHVSAQSTESTQELLPASKNSNSSSSTSEQTSSTSEQPSSSDSSSFPSDLQETQRSMINDVEDAAQIARAAADQALATAANALDPEKEVTKEDLIAAIKACTIAANKATADADAAQAKAKAIESGLNIANATVAMANAATAQALAREKESSGKVKRFEISLTTAYAHIGALTNQLQQLEEAAAAAEARLVNSSSDTSKQNKPTVSSEGVQTQEDESAALQHSQTEGTSSAFFDESSGQHHNQMRIHGDSYSRPSSAPLGRHPLQMQPKMIASALPQMQQKLAQAQREKAIAEGDVERLAAILNEARTRIHHLEKVVAHLNTTSAQQQVVINAFEQQQRQQQELDYDALEGTGGPMLMSQSGIALTRPGTAIRPGTAKGSIPAASHQKSGVEMLNLMTRVTERDKMKKELVKAQKHASSLEKVVFSLKKELQAAGEEVRTLQREKMLLENQMSLLESRIDEFRSMLRASNRVQQQQQQHQQQQQGGFGASSIVGGHRPLQSQFRPPSAMMSRPLHSQQIFHSSPPVHQQISIQVSESAGFADESQVLGESHAVGIDEGTSKE
jgi:hypothetical protein